MCSACVERRGRPTSVVVERTLGPGDALWSHVRNHGVNSDLLAYLRKRAQ